MQKSRRGLLPAARSNFRKRTAYLSPRATNRQNFEFRPTREFPKRADRGASYRPLFGSARCGWDWFQACVRPAFQWRRQVNARVKHAAAWSNRLYSTANCAGPVLCNIAHLIGYCSRPLAANVLKGFRWLTLASRVLHSLRRSSPSPQCLASRPPPLRQVRIPRAVWERRVVGTLSREAVPPMEGVRRWVAPARCPATPEAA